MGKQSSPVLKLLDAQGRKLYMITDRIAGNVNSQVIKAERGTLMYHSIDEAKIFKDRILEIHNGICIRR